MDEKNVFLSILSLVALGCGNEDDLGNDMDAIMRCSSPDGALMVNSAVAEMMEKVHGETAGV